MSECIVRMKIPKSCWDCPCFDDYGDYPRCEITNEQRGYNFPIHEKRMPNCPIICQLPEGHGRLIDADSMEKDLNYDVELDAKALDDMSIVGYARERFQFDKNRKQDCIRYLSGQKTIVPAERREI